MCRGMDSSVARGVSLVAKSLLSSQCSMVWLKGKKSLAAVVVLSGV